MPRLELSLKTEDDKLDSTVQARVFQFLTKLRSDDTSSGLNIETMSHQRDPRARTGRVTLSWRALLFLVHDDDGERRYIYAGTYEHDEACKRAQTRVLRTNPVTNVTEIITATTPASAAAPPALPTAGPPTKPPASSYLGEHGYPVVDLVNQLGFDVADAQRMYDAETADELMIIGDRFENEWQRLAALGMAAGDTIQAIRVELGFDEQATGTTEPAAEPAASEPVPATDIAESTAIDVATIEPSSDAEIVASLAHPASRMQFTLVSDDAELERILTQGDFGAWRTFLHPQQQRYVDRDYNGPFRLTGGAGTGKTVVLLHRTRRLVRCGPSARVILTTFTKALAGMLERDLLRLDEATPLAPVMGTPGVLVKGIDALGAAVRNRADDDEWEQIGQKTLGRSVTRCGMVSNDHGWDAAASAADGLPGEMASPAFLEAEYLQIVLPHHITTVGQYLAVKRPGRGVRLNRGQRITVWAAIEKYRENAAARRELAWAELSMLASAYLQEHPDQAPADHVLVDEGQDFSPLHWQLVRALAPRTRNDLFIAEDVHQRIYGQRVMLSRYGIATVGRSRRLTLNYRTTWENLRYALGVLQGAEFIDAADDVEDTGGYRSARRGPSPQVIEAANPTEQANVIASLITEWHKSGGDAIAVLGRTTPALRRLHRQLEQRGVKTELYSGQGGMSVPQLVTMHSAKGLEFSRVVLYDISEGSVPLPAALAGLEGAERDDALLRERSLLYVAATRARDELFVTWSGKRSELLK